MALRRAARLGPQLLNVAQQTAAGTRSAYGAAYEGNSVAALMKSLSSNGVTPLGLQAAKATVTPFYPTAAKDTGLSLNAKLALGALAGYVYYRYTVQATAHAWIVDLSLNVLQSAWWISFLSFLPFRGIYVALRGIAPHTAGPLNALKPAFSIK